jgi:positive phototaxis protein PixI
VNNANLTLNRSIDSAVFSVNSMESAQRTEQFLRCHIRPDTNILLPITQLAEILNIPVEQITPIPALPPWVMGVYNWRGEILWVVDLGNLLGLPACHQEGIYTASYSTVIIHSLDHQGGTSRLGGQTLGLAVSQVQDIEWLNPDALQSPPPAAITVALAPFLRGYWFKPTEEIFLCLDGQSLFAAMPQAQ